MDLHLRQRGHWRSRRTSRPEFWFGLLIVALAMSLFPAEASPPGLAGTTPALRSACSNDVIASATWGTCVIGGDCCGGRPEGECNRGVF